ncbi:N-acetyltransferase [Phycicoccus sp.]|uniref:GNAT family N-acetyltransferase n=1 Tax=Phycicoccus sp. TaxID=1902410 RepID=UPI002C015776|nr:N-acetyltransferase [Phycicoccus sp.]HMM94365.1 N-acetyltransferase [Phycicoccus sp.]
MRRAGPADAAAMRVVCLRTGAAGGDATALHADPDLLGEVWAVPYLHAPGAVARVVEDDDGVAGYCVAVPDTAAFEEWLEASWWPRLRERRPPPDATPADRALHRLADDPPRTAPELLADHPAHLHVDLLPRLQGQGWGRRLLASVVDELAAAGVTGLHLGVHPDNTGAVAFYERLGFTTLRPDTGGGPVLGLRLRPDHPGGAPAPGTENPES